MSADPRWSDETLEAVAAVIWRDEHDSPWPPTEALHIKQGSLDAAGRAEPYRDLALAVLRELADAGLLVNEAWRQGHANLSAELTEVVDENEKFERERDEAQFHLERYSKAYEQLHDDVEAIAGEADQRAKRLAFGDENTDRIALLLCEEVRDNLRAALAAPAEPQTGGVVSGPGYVVPSGCDGRPPFAANHAKEQAS